MYIVLAMDPTFSWVDLFVVRHHVVSHNGLCQLARGLRTESCEGQNRENHKIQWERLNYPTSFSSFFTDLRLILEVCLLMPVPLLSRDDWLPGEKNETHTSVSIKYQISSHHKVKLIYPAARFTPSPEVRLVGFLDILCKLVPSATWSHLQLASLCCSWGAIELANTHRGVCLPNLDSMLMASITSYPIFSNKFPAQWQKLLSACVKRCEFYRWHCLPIWYYRTAYVKMTKLLLAYEQMSQSFSVAMLVAMTAYVITFERMGRHAKHHPPSQTVAAKVQSSK